jgi:proteasome lid subunit RPN8/RPN11
MDPLNFLFQMHLIIPASLYTEMQDQVQRHAPEEACGLLAGTLIGEKFQARAVLPVENLLHSPVRFRMEPHAQLEALSWIDAHGYTLAGIYHSHPNGPPHPSPTDLAEAFYPAAAYLIWYPENHLWSCRAYRLSASSYEEVKYHLIADEQL